MTSRDFVYWLQGFMEISGSNELSSRQIGIIKNHLNLVFKHEIDPSYGLNEKKSLEYQNIHDGKSDVLLRC